ncbi:MAG: Ig-like domain-containing protein, partial [Ruminococcus sp.]|nr:Ig-like domain-containing protein [Ruminococcus sp.]
MKKFISILISAVMVASIFTSLPVNTFAAKKKAQRVSLKKKSVTIKIIESENNIAYGITSVKIKKAKGVTIKKITYKSTNKKIAKVNKKGVVTAVKKGTAKIKAIVKYKFKKRNYTKKLTLKVKV